MRTGILRLLSFALALLVLASLPATAQSPGGNAASGSAASAGMGAPLDQHALDELASKVRSNFSRSSDDTVLAPGTPPLTMASLRAFADLMRLTFGVEMTSAEFEITRQHFVAYYTQGDQRTKQMLALGWQSILAKINAASGAERKKQVDEVRAVFADRFEKGAREGIPWFAAMWATIERRMVPVARVDAPLTVYAQQAGFNREMSEADLDASLEMLYFMWVACGRDASAVTPAVVVQVRAAIVQTFPMFAPDVQFVFANAQQVYATLRAQWANATQAQRMQMAMGFAQALDALGLTVDGGGGESRGGAWSNMSSQSHSDWAASMVQGLAGSSYHSSW